MDPELEKNGKNGKNSVTSVRLDPEKKRILVERFGNLTAALEWAVRSIPVEGDSLALELPERLRNGYRLLREMDAAQERLSEKRGVLSTRAITVQLEVEEGISEKVARSRLWDLERHGVVQVHMHLYDGSALVIRSIEERDRLRGHTSVVRTEGATA